MNIMSFGLFEIDKIVSDIILILIDWMHGFVATPPKSCKCTKNQIGVRFTIIVNIMQISLFVSWITYVTKHRVISHFLSIILGFVPFQC